MNSNETVSTKKGKRVNSKYAWVVVIGVLCAGLLVSFARLKVPAMMGTIIGEFQVPITSVGWLMGVFSLTSIILAIPIGIIVGKIGTKKSVLLAVTCVALGCVCALLSQTFPMLMAGRVLEGVSYPLIGVVGPATVSIWFSKDRRGLPAGLWSLWAPIGSTLAMNTAPSLLNAGGWQIVYWANCGIAVIVFIYLLLFFRARPDFDETGNEFSVSTKTLAAGVTFSEALHSTFAVMKMPVLWILVLCQFAFASVGGTTQSYANTYLQEVFGLEISVANAMSSLQFISCIFAAIIIGAISDRLKKRKMFIVIGYVVLLVICVLWMVNSVTVQWINFLLIGIAGGLIPSQVYASPGEVIAGDPKASKLSMAPAVAAAMGLVTLCSALGNFFGPILGGYCTAWFGYQFALVWCIPIVAIMFILVVWKLKLR